MLLLVTSCNDPEMVVMSKKDFEKLTGDTSKYKYPKPFTLHTSEMKYFGNSDGIVLGSDNHEYLIIDFGRNSSSVEHYIDCELCQKRNSELKK
jgi:hypothetical protein